MYTRRARMTPLSPPAAACGLKGKLTDGDEKSLTLLKHHFASRTCQSMALDNRKSIPAPALSKFLSFYSVRRKRSNASLTREPISINHSVHKILMCQRLQQRVFSMNSFPDASHTHLSFSRCEAQSICN